MRQVALYTRVSTDRQTTVKQERYRLMILACYSRTLSP
jgi:DNA invertase Pin-like site-specific DNA recombinase